MEKVKCPHCEFEFIEDLEKIYSQNFTDWRKDLRGKKKKPKKKKTSVNLKCPKCGKEFEYNWEK